MTTARLAVGPGRGRLARRADGLLFVGGQPDPRRWAPIIDAYLDAGADDDAREAVTAAAVEARFALDPFVMVAWASAIELLVLGDIEVRTDMPSVPSLTGTGTATWVEHRVARPPAAACLSAGAATEPGTRLDAGAIAAGGFAVVLSLDILRAPTPATVGSAQAPAILDAPGGGWEHQDPEMTIRPPATLLAQRHAAAVTVTPGLVRARRCSRGHPNPPHAAQCRTCGGLIGSTSPIETVAQPTLGQIVLPDGTAIAVNGTSVLGRKPDTETARVESTAHLVPLAVDAGVSRTHVVVRAEGWTITATDCGSRGRTVLRSPGAADPEVLEPWVPHELEPGDTLYLGGPTHLQVINP